MLRIVQQSAAPAAKSYYSKADYYVDGTELVGCWGGKAAERLHLHGEVGKAAFDALCDNLDPRTGKPLTARTRADRTVLYDFNFHVPKSVTLAYELGGDARVLDAFREAVEATMRDAEAEAAARVRKGRKESDRTTGNLVWASFVHRTARPAKEDGKPDPHLHAHVCVFNATYDDTEKQWKAGQFRGLKQDAPYWEAAFQARLARKLTRLGYSPERRGNGWELAGVTPALAKKFSRRTAEIDRLAASKGITDPEAKARLGATSRQNKTPDTIADLRAYWQGRLTAAERTALGSLRNTPAGPSPDPALGAEAAVRYAAAHWFEQSAVLDARRFYATALARGAGTLTPETVRAEAARQGVLELPLAGRTVVTHREVLAQERRLLAFAQGGRGTRKPLAPAHTPDSKLNPGQAAAVAHVLTSADRVMLVQGVAGTGKTTLTRDAVAAIESAGKPVAVLAPTSLAARDVLRGEGFAQADTVAAFLASDQARAAYRGGVLWVDEAGMLSVADMDRLFAAAGGLDARVVLMGDVKQHGSVARGPALRLLASHAGLPTARVADIRRQRGDYREAVKLLAAGDAAGGLRRLDKLGWVKEASDGDREKLVAADYLATLARGQTGLIIAPTHHDGQSITAAVREAMKAEGKLGAESTVYQLTPLHRTTAERADPHAYAGGEVVQFVKPATGHRAGDRLAVDDPANLPLAQADRFQVYRPGELALAVGDRVRLTANGKTLAGKKLNNGAGYTFEGLTPAGDLRLSGGHVLPAEFGHLAHGYVSTSHASQGRTVDRVIVAVSEASLPAAGREQLYVSLSRGRHSAALYTDSRETLDLAAGRGETRLAATDLVGGRRPSQLARRVGFVNRLASLARAARAARPVRAYSPHAEVA